jgi:VWFA-related protein
MRSGWVAAALLLIPFAFPSAAVKPVIPRAGETIEVSIVNLDVIVTDKRGHRIHGLTKDDFEVFEDGKPQPISNFAAYAPEAKSVVTDSKTSLTTLEAPKRQHRTIVVFIEQFKLPGFRTQSIFGSLKKSLHEIVSPGDSVLIAKWNVHTSIRQDYTDDLSTIDKTIDQIAKECTGAAFDTLSTRRDEIEAMKEWFDEAASAAAANGMSAGSTDSKWAIDVDTTDLMERERTLMIAKAEAVNALISTMANDEGRKAMILMTRRFGRYSGAEFFYTASPGQPMDPEKRGRYQTYTVLDTIKATANAHAVTIYAAYPPGLEYTNFSGPSSRSMPAPGQQSADYQVLDNELAALGDLTKATGGTLSWGSVDIAEQLPRLRDDFEDYYSLAYRVSSRNDDRARGVIVTTKNRDYVVRSRKQYMEKSDDGRIRDQVIASLFRPAAPHGISVTAAAGKPAQRDKHHYLLPVTVRVPASSFMTTQEGSAAKGAFTVYIATGRVVGQTSDITKQTIPFTVADVEKAKDGFFTYDFQLLTDFTTNRLSVGVYDEVSHDSGFAKLDLYSMKD